MTTSQLRLAKLRSIMAEAGLAIVALIPGANFRYLTSSVHYLMERPIVLFIPAYEQPLAVIPQLEVPLFLDNPLRPRIVSWSDSEGYSHAFQKGLAMLDAGGKTIGVEGTRMRFFEGEEIRKQAKRVEVVNADSQLANLRITKDINEVESMRKAIEISEQAFHLTLESVKIGMTEIELAEVLDRNMKALGSEEPAFSTILHGGSNTALPHTGPLPYRLQQGDPLLIDFGAVYDGYRADLTRTVFLGEPDRSLQNFYNAVQAANAAAFAAAKPGVEAQVVDRAARATLTEAGFKDLIRHRTGHGIGLETHEEPYIVEGSNRVLEPGMLFTIEPGIYRLGQVGVRIEDDVLVTHNGAEYLSTLERGIVVVEPS